MPNPIHTIYSFSGEDSLVLRMRKYSGNKIRNASRANSTFYPGDRHKGLTILVIIDINS
jgi:hypothetical protein